MRIEMDSKKLGKLLQKKLFLFDIDGTLALGNELIRGSKEILGFLKESRKKVYFITNNSTRSQDDYVDCFAQWGIRSHDDVIL